MAQKNASRNFGTRQLPNNFCISSTRSILLLFTGFVLCGIFITPFKHLLHKRRLIVRQLPQSADMLPQQGPVIMQLRDMPSNEEAQSEEGEKPLQDLAASSAAHTAQLTLISILLGVVMQALLTGLPVPINFVSTLLTQQYLSVDFRVLATFLAAIDLWIKYSWGVIIIRWPFSLSHNLIYSLVSGLMIGLAMSVSNLDAWIGWGTAFCFASSLAYIQNMQSAFSEKKHREAHSHRPIASEDPPYSTKALTLLRNSSIGNALFILVPGSIGLYSTLNNYHLLPLWLRWKLSFSPDMWGVCVTFFVLVDLFIASRVIMPRERYGHTTSSSTIYYYSDVIENE